jgi:hypothetical protein
MNEKTKNPILSSSPDTGIYIKGKGKVGFITSQPNTSKTPAYSFCDDSQAMLSKLDSLKFTTEGAFDLSFFGKPISEIIEEWQYLNFFHKNMKPALGLDPNNVIYEIQKKYKEETGKNPPEEYNELDEN